MLNLTKTTPSGRFTVRITSKSLDAELVTVEACVRDLVELAKVLADASETAVQLATEFSVGISPLSDAAVAKGREVL